MTWSASFSLSDRQSLRSIALQVLVCLQAARDARLAHRGMHPVAQSSTDLMTKPTWGLKGKHILVAIS
ncbi:MAG: hypothetical protein EBV92_06710, partial [Betaproteobacteria bacterium]|nr:hypothetical protein [Betaproteobacteria bacterium]